MSDPPPAQPRLMGVRHLRPLRHSIARPTSQPDSDYGSFADVPSLGNPPPSLPRSPRDDETSYQVWQGPLFNPAFVAEDAGDGIEDAVSRRTSRISSGRGSVNPSVDLDHNYNRNAKVTADPSQHDNRGDISASFSNEFATPVPLRKLFRFADRYDMLFVALGTLGAIVNGATFPLFLLIFGSMNGIVSSNGRDCDATCDGNSTLARNQMGVQAKYICFVGVATFLSSAVQTAFWSIAAERQIHALRTHLFRALLRMDMSFYDRRGTGALTHIMVANVALVRDGIGDKLAVAIMSAALFTGNIVMAFVSSWKLTLVMLAFVPLIVFSFVVSSLIGSHLTSGEMESYREAAEVADEALAGIRTVVSHDAAEFEQRRYDKRLNVADSYGVKKNALTGFALGFVNFTLFAGFGLGLWYGTKLSVEDPTFGDEEFLSVFFAVIFGAQYVAQMMEMLGDLNVSRSAAAKIFDIIDSRPTIDCFSERGYKPKERRHSDRVLIEFQDVHFCYPGAESSVLRGLNMSVRRGQTVAIVGASGVGKSSVLHLLLRFYDPFRGRILFDGVPLKDLNVPWLRKQFSIVFQRPELFQSSIEENVKLGNVRASSEDIRHAFAAANASGFVHRLPHKEQTVVGDNGGARLSGGQKQRLAFARAFLSDASVLLLDEATSALDSVSERVIQDALEDAQADRKRTIIVVAHRLSTVRNADVIFVLDDGGIVESGSHDELMGIENGKYQNLVFNQQLTSLEEDEDDPDAVHYVPGFQERPSSIVRRLSNKLKKSFRRSKRPVRGESTAVSVKRRSWKRRRHSSVGSPFPLARPLSITSEPDYDETDFPAFDDDDEEIEATAKWSRLFRLNGSELSSIVMGCFSSFVVGAVFPTFAVVFAQNLELLSNPSSESLDRVVLFVVIFLVIGIVDLIAHGLQGYFFGRSGQALTSRLRSQFFSALLHKEISWYDFPENAVNKLATSLSTDCSLVQGMTGIRIGRLVECLCNLIFSVVVAAFFGWKLALLMLATFPFLALGGFLEFQFLQRDSGVAASEQEEEALALAAESIESIRTVSSLSLETTREADFKCRLVLGRRESFNRAFFHAMAYAYSQSILLFVTAGCFYFAAWLVDTCQMCYLQVITVFAAIVFSSQAIAEASTLTPNYAQAKMAAGRLLKTIDEVLEARGFVHGMAPQPPPNADNIEETYESQDLISFHSVRFTYPTRPKAKILRGLTLSINRGRSLALVGPSGCGKSTAVQLLARFYDPTDGFLTFEGNDVRTCSAGFLRRRVAYVQQEPFLFRGSVLQNVAYGLESTEYDMDAVIAVAKIAQIHDWIMTHPDGFHRDVGPKGRALSGGQRQRVALARALLRRPVVLILDEATSALDSRTEAALIAALDDYATRNKMTRVVIAHRLSTIVNADVIVVIADGKVSESGTHRELIRKDGPYRRMCKAQGFGV